MPYINVKTIFATVIAVIAILIYRYFFGKEGIVDEIIVGIISAIVGSVAGFFYENYFEKHDYTITDIIDNIVWFLLFCIPGAFIGLIANSLILGDDNTNGYLISLVTVIASLLFTYWKIISKAKKRSNQNT